VALTTAGPALDARHYWREEVAWIRKPGTTVDPSGRLSIVTRLMLGRREVPQGIEICDEPFLPKPPEVYCGIHLRERLDSEMLEGLADVMADALRARPSDTASSRPEFDARWEAPAGDGASRG
jgi:hypothetical protein